MSSKMNKAQLETMVRDLQSANAGQSALLKQKEKDIQALCNDIGEIVKALGIPGTVKLEDILAHIKGKTNNDIIFTPTRTQGQTLEWLVDVLCMPNSAIGTIRPGQFLADLTQKKWSMASAEAISMEVRNHRLEFIVDKMIYKQNPQKWLFVYEIIKKTVTAEGGPFRYEFHNGRQIISLKYS